MKWVRNELRQMLDLGGVRVSITNDAERCTAHVYAGTELLHSFPVGAGDECEKRQAALHGLADFLESWAAAARCKAAEYNNP